MIPFRSELALYNLIESGKLIGISGSYVDNLFRTDWDRFHEISIKNHERFQMSEYDTVPFENPGQPRMLSTAPEFLYNKAEKSTIERLLYCVSIDA